MTRHYDGAAIARHLIFVRNDGSFAVQWDATRVQDILTGKFTPFADKDYGHAITDFELEQLREAGRLSHYDRAFVWLHALPEGDRFDAFQIRQETSKRIRNFYLNTTLPIELLDTVAQQIRELGLHTKYSAKREGNLVAIMNKNGQPFRRLAEVETAQTVLRRAAPTLLQDAAVAFIETSLNTAPPGENLDDVQILDFDTLVASQTQPLPNNDKLVIIADHDEVFLETATKTLDALGGVHLVTVPTGKEALYKIEDLEPDLVLMELVLPDAHAWQILGKMRGNQALSTIPVIIVSALGSQSDQVLAVSVAKVYDYLVKPVPPGLLRKSIWTALQET